MKPCIKPPKVFTLFCYLMRNIIWYLCYNPRLTRFTSSVRVSQNQALSFSVCLAEYKFTNQLWLFWGIYILINTSHEEALFPWSVYQNQNFRNNHSWWSVMAHCFRSGRFHYAEICSELHGIIVQWKLLCDDVVKNLLQLMHRFSKTSHSEREMSFNLVRCRSVSGFCPTSLCKWRRTPKLNGVSWGDLKERGIKTGVGGAKPCLCDLLTWSLCGGETQRLFLQIQISPP